MQAINSLQMLKIYQVYILIDTHQGERVQNFGLNLHLITILLKKTEILILLLYFKLIFYS